MMNTRLMLVLASVMVAGRASADQSVFDFEGSLAASEGPAQMSLFQGTAFGHFTTDTIGGESTGVYQFPAAGPTQGLRVDHMAPPNGGGAYVNQYTLGYDIKWTGAFPWASFMQTNTNNANDGDLFRNPDGGIGISGVYDGTMLNDQWYRVMFAFDLADADGDGQTLYKYINGTLVGAQNPGGLDGRFSLDPFLIILADNDGDTSDGSISSFLFTDRVMSAAEIARFGGPTAGGFANRGGVVPEPSTLALLGLGVLPGLLRRGRKHRRE